MPPERDNRDVDAAFAEIVAHWGDPDTSPVAPWPAQEDAGEDRADDVTPDVLAVGDTREETGDEATDGVLAGASRDGVALGPRDHSPAETEDEGYEPPEPPPIPRGDLTGRLAWAGVLLGPVFLLLAALVRPDVGRWWIVLAVVAFVGGFVTLVARLPAHRGEDDNDDGAVV